MYLITYKYTKKFYLREKSAVKDFPLFNKIKDSKEKRTEVFNKYAHFAKSIKNTGSSIKICELPTFTPCALSKFRQRFILYFKEKGCERVQTRSHLEKL